MEFRRAMERLGLVNHVEDVKQMRRLWRMLDEEDAGVVDYRTFCIKLFPECAGQGGGEGMGPVDATAACLIVYDRDPRAAPLPQVRDRDAGVGCG